MKKLLLLVAAVAMLSLLSLAQVPFPDVYGTTVMPDGSPIPGVTVTLTGDVSAKMTAVTSEEGNFRFLRLQPGNYELTFELDGFKTVIRKGIRLSLGRNATLTIQMETSTVKEEIVVTAKVGVVDTRKTQVGANISKESIQSLPTSRNVWTLLQLIPGMQVDRVDVGGQESGQQSNFFANGASSDDTLWNVDGANITDNSALGSAPSYLDVNSYEELQVTNGSNDITAQTGGVQLNFVTKRAGNRFSGDFHWYYEDMDFELTKALPTYLQTTITNRGFTPTTPGINRLNQYGINFGGPIIKDKLFFFGSYGVQDIHARTEIGTEDFTLLVSGYFKLNFQAGNTSGDFHVTYDAKKKWGRTALTPAQQNDGSLWDQRGPGAVYYGGIQHVMGNLMLTIKAVYTDGGFLLDPRGANLVTEGGFTYNRGKDSLYIGVPTLLLDGICHYETNRNQINASADGNYFAEKVLGGDHEIRFGVDYTNATTTTISLYPNQRQLYVAYQASPLVFAQVSWYPGYYPDVTYDRISAYVADTATFGKLSVNLGLRFDYETGKVNAINYPGLTWYEPGNAHNGEQIFWAEGMCPLSVIDKKSDGTYQRLSPRLSFSYDITGDGKNVIKASLAQYGSQAGNGLATPYLPYRYSYSYWYDYNGDLKVTYDEVQWNTLYGTDTLRILDTATGLDRTSFADDFNSPVMDEATLSFEKALMEDLAVSITGIYRKQHNLRFNKGWTDINGTVETAANWYILKSAYSVNGFTTPVWDRHISPFGYYFYNSKKSYNLFYGVNVALTKKLSNKWMADASFSYGDFKQHRDPDDYLNQTNFDYYDDAVVAPESAGSGYRGIFTNATWTARFSGLYQLPYDINISAVFLAREGYPYVLRRYSYGQTYGRIYTYDASAGKFGTKRMPTFWNLNLGVEKTFKVSDTTSVTFLIDAYNISNNQIALIYEFSSGAALGTVPDSERTIKTSTPTVFQFGVRVNF